jgi:2'-5' RNA ligase
MIRLFAAIPMPEDIAAALAETRIGLPGARWRPPESLHLTLRFAGDIDEAKAADLETELAVISAAPFALRLVGVGSFGDERGAHALWAAVEASEPLRLLAKRCETAARRAGLPPQRRVWRPHVTLAYLRGSDPARLGAWIQAQNLLRTPPFTVASFGLYSSWRTAEGSRYRLERFYRLAAAA